MLRRFAVCAAVFFKDFARNRGGTARGGIPSVFFFPLARNYGTMERGASNRRRDASVLGEVSGQNQAPTSIQ